jgi:uncharacterized membrane protein
MTLLIIGLLLWSGIHFVPSLGIGVRAGLVAKLGLPAYKGLFALLIVASIVVMVFGWRSIEPAMVYSPPPWGLHVTHVLVLLTFILFVAAKRNTNIKRVLRHPQLTGVVLWSAGHLFANGEDRSLVLFIGIGIWAMVEMALINRRVGAWVRPGPVPMVRDVVTLAGGVVLFAVLLVLHRYITGVSLLS